MLEKVKTALRIKTNAYDDELTDLIASAQLDLGVAGVVDGEIGDQAPVQAYGRDQNRGEPPPAEELGLCLGAACALVRLGVDEDGLPGAERVGPRREVLHMHAVERVDLRLEALAAPLVDAADNLGPGRELEEEGPVSPVVLAQDHKKPVNRTLGAEAVTEDLKAFQQRLVDLRCMHYSVHCSP